MKSGSFPGSRNFGKAEKNRKTSMLGKQLLLVLIFGCIISYAAALDVNSYEVVDRLLSLSKPGAPEIIEDAVLFTYTSNCRRAGVAFAYEGFSRVHWLRLLQIPQDPAGAPVPVGRKMPAYYKDSGILFYIHQLPEDLKVLEYRLIIDGLWIVDPSNPLSRKDNSNGLEYSVLALPVKQEKPELLRGPPGTLNFTFTAAPGETVTLSGSFNNWDPFMYEMKEGPAGIYKLTLSLPPGKHQYIFYYRGERWLDPNNPNRAYSREGRAVSQAVIDE